VSSTVERRTRCVRNILVYGLHSSPRVFEFPSALEADLVRSLLDCEYAAQVTVMASEESLNQPPQEFHKSCARLRRSESPLASSQSSSLRMLVRAKAIEQSAAP